MKSDITKKNSESLRFDWSISAHSVSRHAVIDVRNFNAVIDLKSLKFEVPTICLVTGASRDTGTDVTLVLIRPLYSSEYYKSGYLLYTKFGRQHYFSTRAGQISAPQPNARSVPSIFGEEFRHQNLVPRTIRDRDRKKMK